MARTFFTGSKPSTQRDTYTSENKVTLAPDDYFDPSLPMSEDNHPPCAACDLNVAGAPCTCLDWLGESNVA